MCPGTDCLEELDATDKVCDACWRYRLTLHNQLPYRWRVGVASLSPGANNEARVSGGAGPGSKPPLRIAVVAQLDQTLDVLLLWARILRSLQGVTPLPDARHARADWLFCRALATMRSFDHLFEDTKTGIDYYGELYNATRALGQVTGLLGPESQRLPDVCPTCDCMTLLSRDFDRYVACLTCGSRWGQAAFQVVRAKSRNSNARSRKER